MDHDRFYRPLTPHPMVSVCASPSSYQTSFYKVRQARGRSRDDVAEDDWRAPPSPRSEWAVSKQKRAWIGKEINAHFLSSRPLLLYMRKRIRCVLLYIVMYAHAWIYIAMNKQLRLVSGLGFCLYVSIFLCFSYLYTNKHFVYGAVHK